MNHSQLRAFHAVASEGSFSRAAARLGLSQPTLSAHIKALEEGYGVRLFERGGRGRGLRLSALAEALCEVTERYFATEEEARRLLTDAKGQVRGKLRIGADSPHIVLPLLARFSGRYPRVETAVRFANSAALLADVLAARIDIGILPGVAPDRRLLRTAIGKEQLVAIAPRGHAWSGRRRVPLSAFAGEVLVRREPGSLTRALFDRALAERAVAPREVIEMGSREAVKEAVAAGLGVSVIFESEIGGDGRLTSLELQDAEIKIAEFAICRAERQSETALAAFLDIARDTGPLS